MQMEFDFSILKDVGIGGIAIFALHILYKCFLFFIEIWKESTEAINRNTETHNNLKTVFEAFHESNEKFQKDAMVLMKDTNEIVKDTNRKVLRINKQLQGGE